MLRRRFFFTLGLSLLFVTAVACSSEDDNASSPIVGVNDVTKACAIRAQWTRTSSLDCTDCLGIATTPLCDCTARKDYAAKCSDQKTAQNREATCAGVGECVFRCAAGDCACVDACYVNKEICRERASAVDGCIAEVCAPHCR